MHPSLTSIGHALARPFRQLEKKIAQSDKKPKSGPLAKVFGALQTEAKLGPTIHKEALAALRRMKAKDPSLEEFLRNAHGYAVIPRVGKASVVLGGAFGMGEVFVNDHVIGYAAIVQMTVGVQLGGQTYTELLVFNSREDLERFKQSKTSFSANASAVIVTAGAAASAGRQGTKVFVQPEGGLGIEADIGGQKIVYKPAALGRIRGLLEPASGQHAH